MKRIFFLLCWLPLLVQGQSVLTVANKGAMYTSGNAAIAAANTGDTIRFLENVFGEVVVNKSVVLSGGGITGWQKKDKWTNIGGGIWETTCTNPDVTQLQINGIKYNRGRSKDYYAEGFTGTTITNSKLDSAVNDYEGVELIFAPSLWIKERVLVSTHKATTLTFTHIGLWGGNNFMFNNAPFFLQNDKRFCTKFGDWYYNRTTKKIGVYFGKANPSTYNIQVPELNDLVTVTANNVTISNVRLDGCNGSGVSNKAPGMKVINSSISNIGRYGIVDLGVFSIITGNKLNNVNTTGIWGEASNSLINDNVITNTSTVDGEANVNGDWTSIGLVVYQADNVTVLRNTFYKSGYCSFLSHKTPGLNVQYNLSDSSCLRKLDGAGFYHIGVTDSNYHPQPMTFRHNIAKNGGGNGFYLDDHTNSITLDSNVAYNNMYSGIYMHNARNCTITNNLAYNNALDGFRFVRDAKGNVVRSWGVTVKGNTFISTSNTSPAAYILASWDGGVQKTINAAYGANAFTPDDAIRQMGVIDSNQYVMPFGYDELSISVQEKYHTTKTNYAYWGHDLHSAHGVKASPYVIHSLGTNLVSYGDVTSSPSLIANDRAGNSIHYWNSRLYASYNDSMTVTKAKALDGDALKVQLSTTDETGYDAGYRSYKNGVAFPLNTNTAIDDSYIVRFSAMAERANTPMQILARQAYGAYQDKEATNKMYPYVGTAQKEYEYLLTGAFRQGDYLMFNFLEPSKSPVYLDNVQLYKPSITLRNPLDYFVVKENTTLLDKVFRLGGSYVNMVGRRVEKVLVPAMSAVVLLPATIVSVQGK